MIYAQDVVSERVTDIFKIISSTSEGQEFKCSSFLNNKATVLVFLSESCPICQKYTPTLKSLWTEYSNKNIQFYGVFPSSSIEIDSVVAFTKKYGITFPLLIDSSQHITSILKARVTPEVIVLSQTGDVMYQGRIDNLFPEIGRKRYAATTHELKDALLSILHSCTGQSQAYRCSWVFY
ncbi:MAG: redoxin domain-containing protein [Ignavibacteria bacterium]|nr:redoxin domain-containing protein [Ignavibacteria bacterium]